MKNARLVLIALILAGIAGAWLVVKTRGHRATPSASQQPSPARQQNLPPQIVSESQLSSLPSQPGAGDPAAGPEAETVERLGPFSISGNDYTVMVHRKNCVPGSAKSRDNVDLGQPVVVMEIQDSRGAVLYQKRLPLSPCGTITGEAWIVSADTLSAADHVGLLVHYTHQDDEPEAPQEEYPDWWQVFGVLGGRLKAFGAPIYSEMVTSDDSRKAGASNSASLPADELQIKKWTGHFRILFPLRVDWAQGKLTPVQTCDVSESAGPEDCQYKVLPEQLRKDDDRTFVSLCPSPGSICENPEKVVVKSDSKVDLLVAQVKVAWNGGLDSILSVKPGQVTNPMADAGSVTLGPADGLWLKVRIDGKEGWMHGEEDFNVLGLPRDE